MSACTCYWQILEYFSPNQIQGCIVSMTMVFLYFLYFFSLIYWLLCLLLFPGIPPFSSPLYMLLCTFPLFLFLQTLYHVHALLFPCLVNCAFFLSCTVWSVSAWYRSKGTLGWSPAGGGGCGIRSYCLLIWDFLPVLFRPIQTEWSRYHRSVDIYI